MWNHKLEIVETTKEYGKKGIEIDWKKRTIKSEKWIRGSKPLKVIPSTVLLIKTHDIWSWF